jgi:outer membrane scaffolding protein for murein synthesis (MipA/OmpV family)
MCTSELSNHKKMAKLLSLALVAACGAASAQTPAVNPMPDGSRDLYLGLGAVSAPRYEGARERRVAALPVLQFEWSNGIFISGMSAGMHLSGAPSVEYGPLLALQPRRNESGNANGIGGIDSAGQPTLVVPQPPLVVTRFAAGSSRLDGMDPIGARLLAGGFFNYYLSPHLRLTSSLLYGSGNERKGATWRIGVQRIAAEAGSHHSVSLSAGLTLANRDYNQAFFGVSPTEAQRSGHGAYQAAGGLKDAFVGARWNWALAPSWLVTSSLQGTRLLGSAKDSPLVERPTNLTVSTALAYRF